MLEHIIQPRFSDMDGLGHISNTAFPIWFEEARTPLFGIFHPSLELKTWPLIIARLELDLVAQTYWGSDVTINTYVKKLGNSSCHIAHEAWQNGKMVAKGIAIIICYDYEKECSRPIPDPVREQLNKYLKPEDS